MADSSSPIGALIRAERERRGLSIAALSRRVGIAQANLSRIEAGRTDPRWSTVVRILDALDVDIGGLLVDRTVGSDPWDRLRRKAQRGEDVRDEAWALAVNTRLRSERAASSASG